MDKTRKTFPDNQPGVESFIKAFYNPGYMNPAICYPDPYKQGVWLVIDPKKEIALVVYLNDFDAEQVQFNGTEYHNYIKRAI